MEKYYKLHYSVPAIAIALTFFFTGKVDGVGIEFWILWFLGWILLATLLEKCYSKS